MYNVHASYKCMWGVTFQNVLSLNILNWVIRLIENTMLAFAFESCEYILVSVFPTHLINKILQN